jgi:Cytochrome P460
VEALLWTPPSQSHDGRHRRADDETGSAATDILKSVSFIEKDTKRFSNTGGWGYAHFHYDGASDAFQPFGNDAACGHACHTAVAAKDYIFTAYPKR